MFGHINGIPVGQVFASRKEVAESGLHSPLMAGIWGANEGAYSIVLSGGYEDDIDDLSYILYTGQGGQNVPGGKQIADQEFKKGNRGLQLSHQYKLPVRVIRGHQIPNGPESGYRYDGLYFVEHVERVRGKRGFLICRFHLVSEMLFEQLESILLPHLKSSYARPSRVQGMTSRFKRDVKLCEKVKSLYDHRCQVCDVKLHSPSGPVAIGAHIKGLGRPHNGPDAIENMLCLCPNHHDQFDRLAFFVDPETLKITGLDGFEEKRIKVTKQHKLDKQFLEYHKELVLMTWEFSPVR